MPEGNSDLELIEFSEEGSIQRRRRRRRRSKKQGDSTTETAMSASGVLAAAALDFGSSPASSAPVSPKGRKMSSLELDDISDEPAHMTSSTWTPGSLDSSRSLWELGSIEADEDEILSLREFSMSPVIPSLRMLQGLEDPASPKTSSISSITAQIESILGSLKSDGQTRMNRLCVPRDVSNRLCVDPSFVPPQVRDWFDSMGSAWDMFSETVAGALQPESVQALVTKLASSPVPKERVPIINRRQRRAFGEK